MSLLLCTIKAHFGLLSEYLQNDLQCKKKFCWISVTLLSPSRPSKDSILSYKQSDVCAPVCDLGSLGSLVRFFYTEWLQNASQ